MGGGIFVVYISDQLIMMRKLFILFVTAVAVISCTKFDEIWDKLNDHELRIKELESLCAQMNTNISSLQTIVKALQDNDYVMGVSAIMENGKEVGYTLTFSKGPTYSAPSVRNSI